MDLTHFPTLKNLLKKYNVWAKKRLGQNFLVDKSVLERIVKIAEIQKGEYIVEIGPGPGVLSRALLEAGANVEAVEIDAEILPVLKEATRSFKKHLVIHQMHVLDFDPPDEPYKLIANIPYHLTSPILRKFLTETEHRPGHIVLLVQKEVGEKICAKKGKESALSQIIKAYGDPQIVSKVPASSFYPIPKVDSAILFIEMYVRPRIHIPAKIFEEMLFAGFAEPRKKLRNVLSRKFQMPGEEIDQILESVGISGDLRPQNLNTQDWENLAKVFFAEYL